jgi:hypothetical protein
MTRPDSAPSEREDQMSAKSRSGMKQDASEVVPSGLQRVVRPMTALERTVAERVRDGLDPWGIWVGAPRIVSQAIGRLRRKGFVAYGYGEHDQAPKPYYFLTELGRLQLGGGKDPRE